MPTLSSEEVYSRFYSDLNPKEYYAFELQKDLALEAINYYILFNNLSIVDIDCISAPYRFTKLSVYMDMYSLIAQVAKNIEEYSLSPDSNGGMCGVYIGEKEIILTIDMNNEHTVSIEYIYKGIMSKTLFSYEVSTPLAIVAIKKILEDLI
jgi:hypothetical protein